MATFTAFRQVVLRTVIRPRPILHLDRQLLAHPRLVRAAHDSSADKDKSKILRDDKIPHRLVQLVDPATKHLLPLRPLAELLASIDRKTQFVELVAEHPAPIVKIIEKKAAYEKRKEQKRRAKEVKRRNIQKEVQLTWGVALGDLEHKLKKVRSDLEKGYRVDLVFAPKSGHELPSPTEMQNRADKTVALLSDVAKEWKPRETRKTMIAIYFQGLGEAGQLEPEEGDQ